MYFFSLKEQKVIPAILIRPNHKKNGFSVKATSFFICPVAGSVKENAGMYCGIINQVHHGLVYERFLGMDFKILIICILAFKNRFSSIDFKQMPNTR